MITIKNLLSFLEEKEMVLKSDRDIIYLNSSESKLNINEITDNSIYEMPVISFNIVLSSTMSDNIQTIKGYVDHETNYIFPDDKKYIKRMIRKCHEIYYYNNISINKINIFYSKIPLKILKSDLYKNNLIQPYVYINLLKYGDTIINTKRYDAIKKYCLDTSSLLSENNVDSYIEKYLSKIIGLKLKIFKGIDCYIIYDKDRNRTLKL